MDTWACVIAPPCASVTVPRMVEVPACPKAFDDANMDATTTASRANRKRERNFINTPPGALRDGGRKREKTRKKEKEVNRKTKSLGHFGTSRDPSTHNPPQPTATALGK